MSVCLSVRPFVPLYLWTDWPLNLSFSTSIGHGPSSPWIESQKSTSRVRATSRIDWRHNSATSTAACWRGETCGVALSRPAAAAESSACGRGNAVMRSVWPRSSVSSFFTVGRQQPKSSQQNTAQYNIDWPTVRLIHIVCYSQFTPPDATQLNSMVDLRHVGRCELAINRRLVKVCMPVYERTFFGHIEFAWKTRFFLFQTGFRDEMEFFYAEIILFNMSEHCLSRVYGQMGRCKRRRCVRAYERILISSVQQTQSVTATQL